MSSPSLQRWLATGLTLLACATAQAQPTTLRIQDYPGIVGTLARVAIEKGYCDNHGIRCTLNVIPAAPLGIQTLMAGGIQVALPPAEVAIQSAIKGSDLKIVSASFRDSPFMLILGKELMASADKGYPALMHDLKGKKVGVTARGAAPEFQVKTLLREAGLKDDDVTFVAIGSPNTGYPSLLNRQVDAAMSFVPFDGFCDVLKTCRVALMPAKGEGPKALVALNGGGGLYVMRNDFIGKNPEAATAFRKAIEDAERFATDPANLDALMAITIKYYRLDIPNGEQILRSSLERFQSAFVADVDRQAVQAAATYLHETGQISKRFDVGGLF